MSFEQSKTDPFRNGVNIYLGATDRPICPVLGILPYLTARGNQTGLLFILDNGKGLTRQTFSVLLDSLLSKLHLDTSASIGTHSFRIGAATSGSYTRHICKDDGSLAEYQLYIKTPPKELAKLSRQLAIPASQ